MVMQRIMKIVESLFAIAVGLMLISYLAAAFYTPIINALTNFTNTTGNTIALTIFTVIYWIIIVAVILGLMFVLVRLAFASYKK